MRREPAFEALGRAQSTVQGHHPTGAEVGKALLQAGLQLRRQIDLGHHHQHLGLRVGLQHLVGGPQVDLGLAAAGGAEEQGRSVGAGKPLKRRLLLRAELGQVGQGRQAGGPIARAGALEAPAQLQRVELAQLRRQRRQGDLAERALVVAGGKADQRSPIGRQGRDTGEHTGDVFALLGAQFAGIAALSPDHAQHFAPAQRHAHQLPRRKRRLTSVGQRPGHAAVGRGGDDDVQPEAHGLGLFFPVSPSQTQLSP